MNLRPFIPLVVVAAVVSGCISESATSSTSTASTDAATGTGSDTIAATGATFYKDIAPILQQKCQGCHLSGGIAPFPLLTYADVKGRAQGIVASTSALRMPPWGARDTALCKPRFGFQHDLRLSPVQLATLKSWADAGAPEGDPHASPTVSAALSLNLADSDVTAQPKVGYVASGNNDYFRCFVLDAEFKERKYINGVQTIPGNPNVVHHVLVFADANNESAKKVDKDGGYDCFGGVGIQSQQLLSAWAPGAVPLEYPPNAGTPIEIGTKLVMQVHYHPTGQTAAIDLTKIQMRFTKGVPEYLGRSTLIGNFNGQVGNNGLMPGPNDPPGKVEFLIPAGKTAHTETMQFTLPSVLNNKPLPELLVYGVGTHMHYVGRDMRIEVSRGSPQAPCIKAQLDLISGCTAANCPGMGGMDMVNCAAAKCQKEVASLAGSCGDCLKTELLKGVADQTALYATCSVVPAKAPSNDPLEECLVETPAWDFNWQRIYNYAAPLDQLPRLHAGDTIKMTCTYDNSLGNPFVSLALQQKSLKDPVDVHLGETTLDEMCLSIIQVLYKIN